MPYDASSRRKRVEMLLKVFDSQRSWPGLGHFADSFGVSRQWVASILKRERPKEYARKKHPSKGRRTDLR